LLKINTALLTFKRHNSSNSTDEELLATFRRTGANAHFGELYNRYIPLLYGLCLKYLEDEDRAEDAVMDLFEVLLPKVGTYEIVVFRTWIHTVARNHCLQILRKENRQPEALRFDIERMESDEVLHLLTEEDDDSERLGALQACLKRLPDQQRQSINAFFVQELSYAEIVDQTGYTLMQVKSYIQNGKRNLKICIEKHQP